MKDYDQFAAEWLGRRVGDPLLVGIDGITAATMYQCVTLIKQYWVECFNLVINYPGSGAIDLWYNTPAAASAKFQRVASSDVQKGDIAVLHTLGYTDATEPGHVVIATGNLNGTDFEGLEQNGATGGGTGLGADEIRTRYIPKSRIAGLLRPAIVSAPNPQPVCSYTAETIPNHVMQCKLQPTDWWNLNVFTTNIGDFQAAATKNQGDQFPVGGYAVNRNFPNYRYAMSPEDFARAIAGDYSTNNGINILDLEEIPVPYSPPAAPATVPLAPKMQLLVIVPTYATAANAANRSNPVRIYKPQMYFLQNTAGNGMQQISPDNQVDGPWINPADNVLPAALPPAPTISPSPSEPEPAIPQQPWITSFKPFNADGSPVIYKATRALTAYDLSDPTSRRKITIKDKELFHAYGTFPLDGVIYVRLKTKDDTAYVKAYAVPILGTDNLPNMLMQSSGGSGPLTLVKDFMNLGRARVETMEASAVEFLDDIIPNWKRKK